MKTLNEVIDEMTNCIEHDMDCSECESFVTCTGRPWRSFDNDALHYLEEYRTYIEKMEKLYHDANTELNLLKDEDWKDRNLPLTWGELKTMEGMPVWVEFPSLGKKVWSLVGKFTGKSIPFVVYIEKTGVGIVYGHENDIGDTWQAYRKERDAES